MDRAGEHFCENTCGVRVNCSVFDGYPPLANLLVIPAHNNQRAFLKGNMKLIWMNSSGQASALPLCAQARRNGMSIYPRGDVWYYLFYINGRCYRGSTKTKNKKQAERVEAKARVAAEAGESLRPKRTPLLREFAKQFADWLEKTTLEPAASFTSCAAMGLEAVA
jgi:hypothetical protein